MKILLFLLLLTVTPRHWLYAQNPEAVAISGIVTDASTKLPVPYAHVGILRTKRGSICDHDGRFIILVSPGLYDLRFSAVGYRAEIRSFRTNGKDTTNIEVSLFTRTIELAEEVIIADREMARDMRSLYDQKLNSIDELTNKVEGVTMLQRANFASEASIRGMSSGQIATVVDGMKIFSACVDHMDPVSAYVEVDNLEKLEVSKGAFDLTQSQTIGGTINMVTEKPDFSKALSAEIETGFESVSRMKRVRSAVNVSGSDIAVRGTFSYRSSGDFYSGRSRRIQGSGFRKNNYKLDLTKKAGESHQFTLSFIGDNAWDIGYPSMLMDARETHSQIYSLEHRWNRSSSKVRSIVSKIYANRITHWMDDYERDVTARSVMKDMYMPMFGETTTAGITEKILFVLKEQTLSCIGEYYYLEAFADMTMKSINENISPMYLVNIGRAGLHNTSIALNYDRTIIDDLYLKMNARADYSSRNLHDETGKRLLKGTAGDTRLHQVYITTGLSSVLEYRFGAIYTASLAIAQSERMPTHLENYGFYLYNIHDGFFYMGNPDLKPERSRQIEWRWHVQRETLRYQLSVFYNVINDYIVGVKSTSEFKSYANIKKAKLTGLEGSGTLNISGHWSLSISGSYVRGQNEEFDEPLPFIPPFQGAAALTFEKDKLWFGFDTRFAARQNRIANKTTLEDRTEGFAVMNIRGSLKWGRHTEWKFGVENIFDTLYHEHLSINDLPGRGRNFYAGLTLTY